MTEQGQQVAAIWREAGFARDWAQGDAFRDVLAFPRRMVLSERLIAFRDTEGRYGLMDEFCAARPISRTR